MSFQKFVLLITVCTLLYLKVFSETTPSQECEEDACKKYARIRCPHSVVICRGPNQEIRPTGWCNCCAGCFNISQVGGPCGPSAPKFKCAKGLECKDDVCVNEDS